MIDAIVYLPHAVPWPDSMRDEDGNLTLSDPQAVNAGGDRLHYVRMTSTQLDAWRPNVTVLAEVPYTGTGTAERVYQQIQNDAEKLAIYESVYDTAPRELDEGADDSVTITPPFKFGMLAESDLPIPASVTSRQGMQQLIISGLDEQVEAAIDSIEDEIQRKLTLAWFHRATDWERDNQQFITLFQALGLTDEQADNHMRAAAQL